MKLYKYPFFTDSFLLPFLIYFLKKKWDFLVSDNQKEKKAIKKPTFRIAPLFPNGHILKLRSERKKLHPTRGRVQAMSGHGHRRKDKRGGGGGGWRWASHFHVRERELQLNTVGICPQCIYVNIYYYLVC